MAETNTFITNVEVTYEAARILLNSLNFAGRIYRQIGKQYSPNQFGAPSASGGGWQNTGGTIFIRKPPRFRSQTGRSAVIQNVTEEYVQLDVTRREHVAFSYTSSDLATSIENISERILKPAIEPIANTIDQVALDIVYKGVSNSTGLPGTVPTDLQVYLDGGAKLLDGGTRDDGRWCAVLSPLSEARIVGGLKGLFNPQAEIGRQYESGRMGRAVNFDWYHDQNIPTHVVGPLGGTPLVDGANQIGASILTRGWTTAAASRLNVGDVFTMGGVYGVNPQTGQAQETLKDFVVTAAFSSDASGNGTVQISPEIIITGAFATVNASPADGAPITVRGAAGTVSRQNIQFHPHGAAIGFVDLPIPPRGNAYRVRHEQLGISMRVWEDADWKEDMIGIRIDVEFGVKVIYPEYFNRVWS